jgi:tRNA(Ile)-lysidine synthase
MAQLIDSSALPAGMQIRNRRRGDRFFPWRAPGERKLKDWLSDRKIPLHKRDLIPLLATGHTVYWVIGARTSGALAATGASEDLYLLAWEGHATEKQEDKRRCVWVH